MAETGVETVLVVVVMRNLFGFEFEFALELWLLDASAEVRDALLGTAVVEEAWGGADSEAPLGLGLRGTEGEADRFVASGAAPAVDEVPLAAPVAALEDAAAFFAGGGLRSSFSRSRFEPVPVLLEEDPAGPVDGGAEPPPAVGADLSLVFSRFVVVDDDPDSLRPLTCGSSALASCILTSPPASVAAALVSAPVEEADCSTARSLPLLDEGPTVPALASFAPAPPPALLPGRDDPSLAESFGLRTGPVSLVALVGPATAFFLAFFAGAGAGGSAVPDSSAGAAAAAAGGGTAAVVALVRPLPFLLVSLGLDAGGGAGAGNGSLAGGAAGAGGGTYLGRGGRGKVVGIG